MPDVHGSCYHWGMCRCWGSSQLPETIFVPEGLPPWDHTGSGWPVLSPGPWWYLDLSCCWGTWLDPWFCGSWSLWWCPCFMLPQGFIGTMCFEIQGPYWAGLLLPGPGIADHVQSWSLQQESWPYPTWESQPPHSREMASWLTIDMGELT